MRLTILTQYYPPEIGAPQARLSELAAHFVRNGHDVTVLTAMPNYPSGKIHAGYGGICRRETLNSVNVVRSFIYPTQRAAFLPRMANYISFTLSSAIAGSLLLGRSDFLLVESPPLFHGMSGIWLSLITRSKFIFNVSDLWPESAVRLGMLSTNSLAFRLSVWLEAFCYRKAWLVTGQSKTILSDIQLRFPNKSTFHLSNGVDTQRFCPERKTREARAILCDSEKLVALYAGLHGLAQGLSQILEAAAMVAEIPDLQIVLLGDGPEKQDLIDQARRKRIENIRFLESRPSHELPPIVAAADIILVTLKIYIPGAVPSKIYEAMSSGRPVVLVAEGEAASIVRDNRAGIVVRPDHIAGLAEAIRTLHAQPELRQTMGENGRRAAIEFFDREKIAKRFIAYLESGLSHKMETARQS